MLEPQKSPTFDLLFFTQIFMERNNVSNLKKKIQNVPILLRLKIITHPLAVWIKKTTTKKGVWGEEFNS